MMSWPNPRRIRENESTRRVQYRWISVITLVFRNPSLRAADPIELWPCPLNPPAVEWYTQGPWNRTFARRSSEQQIINYEFPFWNQSACFRTVASYLRFESPIANQIKQRRQKRSRSRLPSALFLADKESDSSSKSSHFPRTCDVGAVKARRVEARNLGVVLLAHLNQVFHALVDQAVRTKDLAHLLLR